jgi:hypothetical protein
MGDKEHRIETITDILNLAPDQRDRFLVDLKSWLEFSDAMKPLVDAGIAEIQPHMIWVDDDRIGEVSSVRLIDKATGDETQVDF